MTYDKLVFRACTRMHARLKAGEVLDDYQAAATGLDRSLTDLNYYAEHSQQLAAAARQPRPGGRFVSLQARLYQLRQLDSWFVTLGTYFTASVDAAAALKKSWKDLATPRIPSAVDLYRDLEALASKFNLRIEAPAGRDKGRFGLKLVLKLPRVGLVDEDSGTVGPMTLTLDLCKVGWIEDASGFVHLEPRDDAPSCRDYFHPHVDTDGHPCLGEASELLPKLLNAGYLFEAVEALVSWYGSYSRGNAYMSVSEIETGEDESGCSCDNCGDSCHEDDTSYCECGEHSVCNDCYVSCDGCGCSSCMGHTTRIHGARYCESCWGVCDVCGERVVDDGDGVPSHCDKCRDTCIDCGDEVYAEVAGDSPPDRCKHCQREHEKEQEHLAPSLQSEPSGSHPGQLDLPLNPPVPEAA
jgi:hypothetical protein